jgi:hypothetical protein
MPIPTPPLKASKRIASVGWPSILLRLHVLAKTGRIEARPKRVVPVTAVKATEKEIIGVDNTSGPGEGGQNRPVEGWKCTGASHVVAVDVVLFHQPPEGSPVFPRLQGGVRDVASVFGQGLSNELTLERFDSQCSPLSEVDFR